jgi:hypothetical protein
MLYLLTKFFKIILKTLFVLVIFSILMTVVFRWVAVPITPLMLIRCAEQKGQRYGFKTRLGANEGHFAQPAIGCSL